MKNFRQFISRPIILFKAKSQKGSKSLYLLFLLKTVAIIAAVYLITGCYNFYRSSTIMAPPAAFIQPQINLQKTFVIHNGREAYYINNVNILGDSLTGNYIGNYMMPYNKTGFPIPNTTNRYIKKKGDSRVTKEIHLYAENVKDLLIPGFKKRTIAITDIKRVDIYDHAADRTGISWILGIIGGAIGAYIAFMLILLLVFALGGGSCPYIYVNTGDGYAFTGEIYSGAVYAPLERDDYLKLPLLVAENGSYKIKMSNELMEIQHTNLTELVVIDHPVKADVLIDKYGKYQTSVQLNVPVSATDFMGKNILNFVNKKDSLVTGTLTDPDNIPLVDGAILTFDLPQGAHTGKLFLRARNSVWLDHVYKKSNEMFGGWYDTWTRKQNKADPARLEEWPLSQNIPLSVFIEKNGKWVFCDYFNMAGPMALKDDVLAIDINGLEKGPVKIKLESGYLFWEIDYVGMDFTINLPVGIKTVRTDKAITNEEKLVTDLLLYDDLKYYVQEEIGNVADISFPVPMKSDLFRTVFLHSKGYYQIISDAKGLPEIKSLKELKEPGQFLIFSRDLLKENIEKISSSKSLQEHN